MNQFRTYLLASVATLGLFGAACSGAETMPADQNAPAHSVSAAVSTPPTASSAGAASSAAAATSAPAGSGRFLARFDHNGDGKIELSELPPRLAERLSAADTNHDGVLSTDELAQFRASHHGDRIKKLDANGDGKIELSELPAKMRERLAKADTNGDGVISHDEFVAFRKQRGIERFQKADKNGDGALTQDEVGAEHWARLQIADANGDGRVTLAEIQQAFASGKLSFGHHHEGGASE